MERPSTKLARHLLTDGKGSPPRAHVMGLVMRFLTPLIVGDAPQPDTAAFWGIAALGLLVGLILTCPMNWSLVKIDGSTACRAAPRIRPQLLRTS